MKKYTAILFYLLLSLALTGCGKDSDYQPVSGLDQEQRVTLTVAIPYETDKALNTVANKFMKKYPNVNVQLQYVEDYDSNALQLFKNNSFDMILQKDVAFMEYTETDSDTNEEHPTGTFTDDYFYDFAADQEMNFSDTIPEITNNYLHTRVDDSGKAISYLYCYPLGGETRGVFVNTTLLDAYGLSVPQNYTELLACCEKLKQNGLIPIQGSPETAAYSLGLAAAANPVVHDAALLEKMQNAEPGISRAFETTLEKLYTLAVNRYFDYKAVEESGGYRITNEQGQAESFLGLQTDENTFEVSKPENNYGYVAFMPYLSSMETVIQSEIDRYGLDTKVQFICAPLNEEGMNRPAYITPYYGICANKNSRNLIWTREFVNFIFQAENNKLYAKEASIIPNTTDAMSIVAKRYDLNPDTDVTLCGQIHFSDDYNGFSPLAAGLRDTLKCSAQKYMINLNRDAAGNIQYETDEAGNEVLYLGNGETTVEKKYIGDEDPTKPGYAFCKIEYYLDELEQEISKYRVE